MYLPYEVWYEILKHIDQEDKKNLAICYELTKNQVNYEININLIAYDSYKNTIYTNNPVIKALDLLIRDLDVITTLKGKIEMYSYLYILVVSNSSMIKINESYNYLKTLKKKIDTRNIKKFKLITEYISRSYRFYN